MSRKSSKSADLILITEQEPTCRKCGSKEVMTAGRRLYEKEGKMRQIYQCKTCGTMFTAGRAYRQWHSAETIDYAVKLIYEGYRPKDISQMIKAKFGEEVKEATARGWFSRFTTVRTSKRTKRVLSPRTLMTTVRRLVPLEQLAKEMGASPVLVDRLMKEIAFIREPPSFLSLGWQIRRTKGARKSLEHTLKVLKKVEEGLLVKSDGGKNATTLTKRAKAEKYP